MKNVDRMAEWLETRWVKPAYGGGILLAIAICFFGAATNTMAGWLYVISGVMLALLGLSAILPARNLKSLRVNRRPIQPVSVGDELTIELDIENPVDKSQNLLQIQDDLPFVLGKPVHTPIETIPPKSVHHWIYYQPAQKRGVYRWMTVQLKTAAPLGLFWCRRDRQIPATAFVYPTVLPLINCPLIDEIGQDTSPQFLSIDRRSQAATEGVTRTLRPYRVGDPTRLIHWRTSARLGQFQVRELETFTGGQEVIICLDSGSIWNPEHFEEAVIAAASLYFYASGRQLNVKLWTALTGLVQGHRVVLETLAATYAGEDAIALSPPNLPLIWLTQNPVTLTALPPASRWVLWMPSSTEAATPVNRNSPGIIINTEQPLQVQLQSPLR
ncbi:DUF58 domain-containing protein [Cyanobacteria bacterium FACHB-472]|nr:DUF58 domain-containing protein [Cyanobacteria bacterium FACHB-472]